MAARRLVPSVVLVMIALSFPEFFSPRLIQMSSHPCDHSATASAIFWYRTGSACDRAGSPLLVTHVRRSDDTLRPATCLWSFLPALQSKGEARYARRCCGF